MWHFTRRSVGVAITLVLALLLGAVGAGGETEGRRAGGPAPERKVSGRRVVDLTHVLKPSIPVFPGGVPLKLIPVVTYDRGYFINRFESGEHTGTHLDAPAHFIEGQATVEAIPPELLVAPAARIEVRAWVKANPDFQLGVDDLRVWEGRYGGLPRGAFLVMDSGWAIRWWQPERYLNKDAGGTMHFPGISPDLARFLTEKRDIVGVGVDTLSIDYGPSRDFLAHRILFKAGKYAVENLGNLDRLPPAGATIIVAPLRIAGGSGSPARVMAIVE